MADLKMKVIVISYRIMYFLETYYFLLIEQRVLLEGQKSYPVYVVFHQCKYWKIFCFKYFLKFN